MTTNENNVKKYVYVIIAYRWGNTEGHSYLVGSCMDLPTAKKIANDENEWRGGKYECIVYRSNLLTHNANPSDMTVNNMEIYNTEDRRDFSLDIDS